ncbi:sugar-binding transcriptional regulator [Pelagibius sp.]|uniref:sugar-binding transcriptional regulator n=1 Tax=Pelagibius sp. TaxID=1931238 RepID=UPI003BB021E9
MSRINELRFIARIAHMYYMEGKRQSAIAAQLHLSQATVSRMLKRAHDENIVRISLASPEGTYAEAEAALRRQYGLTEAIVVDCAEDRQGAIMSRIGEAAAHFLETTIQPGEVIGVSSWSQTILKMIDNIHPMKQGKARSVVQLLGGLGNPSVQKHATQLTTRLAQLTGGEPLILSAPGVAASREAKIVLLGDSYVRSTIEQFRNISLAVVGIGAIEPSQMLADSGNVFSETELAQVTAGGAVSEISLRFFDAEGRDVKTPLDERVIGMTTEELRAVPRVIALAGGQSKTAAIDAALKSGALDILITDRFTAARLVGLPAETQGAVAGL